ncbi:MAG: N-acetyltransferase family protein [Verrucomicrobiaceae bacterium]|nr:N-acetyltransferase family protein [Verrucomicrobiaceae bacterium]
MSADLRSTVLPESARRRSALIVAGEVTIRTAAEADLPAIVEIFNAAVLSRMSTAVLEPVTVDERREWFHEHSPDGHPLFVLVTDDRVAGWLSVHSFITRCAYAGTAEVSVYVHPEFKRRGIGGQLLRHTLSEAPRLGLTALAGLIFGHNQPSLQLFEHCGFTQWGLLPRVARLDGVQRDVVIVGQLIDVE